MPYIKKSQLATYQQYQAYIAYSNASIDAGRTPLSFGPWLEVNYPPAPAKPAKVRRPKAGPEVWVQEKGGRKEYWRDKSGHRLPMEVVRAPNGRLVRWRSWVGRLEQLGVGGPGKWIAVADHRRRYEFGGRGMDLYRAVALAKSGWPPKDSHPYVKVHARDFLADPERYGHSGSWNPIVDS